MKILNILLGLFLLLIGILIDIKLYGCFGCNDYIKTHQRIVLQQGKPANIISSGKYNNWVTYAQMEGRREMRWNERMKRLRDEDNAGGVVVVEYID